VRHLLYGQGYTIRGVQRILREQGASFVQDVWRAGAELPPPEIEEDEEGETAGDAIGEALPPTRREPKLFAAASPRGPAYAAAPDERREPTLEPPAALKPATPRGVGDEGRRKLQAALDELVTCRGIIDAALRQG
jgi:hypothetical protein